MNDKVVTFERARRRPDPARVQEFAETARRLQRERLESADVVTRVLRETPQEEWPRLATRPELRNSVTALRQLGATVTTVVCAIDRLDIPRTVGQDVEVRVAKRAVAGVISPDDELDAAEEPEEESAANLP